MKYFVEEMHTNEEWVWVLKHQAIFKICMVIWFLMLYFIVMLIILMQTIVTNPKIIILIGILLWLFGLFGLGQMLNKFFSIRLRW